MKNHIRFLVVCLAVAAVSFTSCRKDKNDIKDATLDAQFKQFNDDNQFANGEIDQADNDINGALGDIPAFGKIANVQSSPLCGVTIDTSQIAQKIVFFNFDGVTPCFSPSRTRSGQIKVQLTSGNLWSDVNAVLTLTYINFKITRLYDNRNIMFNGIKTLKNLNGNNWIGFFLGTASLKYQARAYNVAVEFDNGAASATWNIARVTEWTYDGSGPLSPKINFTANGDTAMNGYNHVDGWGINRFGYGYTTYYTTPIVSNTYCGLWRPNSGQLIHDVNNSIFTLTLGVDQNGNPTPYNCAYGFKVMWQVNGNTYVRVLTY